MRWMNDNKSRIMDFFRKQDRDHDGRITRQEFIDGILQSKFPTTSMEMEAVADRFDRDNDGFIDYQEFVAALRPERADQRPLQSMNESQRIQYEIKRQENLCTCQRQFRINKIGEGKYCFGDSQKLRLVRILRSTVMVRVGGGWMALDEFLQKNDPCRAKGRTNFELREQFHLPEGASQTMAGFKSRVKSQTGTGGGGGGGSTTDSSCCSSSTASGPAHRHTTTATGPTLSTASRSRLNPDSEVKQIMTPKTGSSLGAPRAGTAGRPRSSSSRNQLTSPCSHGGSRPSSRASVTSEDPRSPGPGGRTTPATAGGRTTPAAGGGGGRVTPAAAQGGGRATPGDVRTSVRSDTKTAGGRTTTTVTYQTSVTQTRTLTTPTAARAASSTSPAPGGGQSRLPKPGSTTTTAAATGRRTPSTSTAPGKPSSTRPTPAATGPTSRTTPTPSRPKKPGSGAASGK